MSEGEERHVNVVIVGGGPHALAVLGALQEGSLAFNMFGPSDTMYDKRVGFGQMEKVGRVAVIDRGEGFMEEWNSRFAALDIEVLRSPTLAHPCAYEPQALMNFAVRTRRTNEIHNVPHVSSRMATDDMSAQQPMLLGLPSAALFRDFSASLAENLEHDWLRGTASEVRRDPESGRFRVRYESEQGSCWVVTDAVVLATGPTGQLNIPRPFSPFMGAGVQHVAELLKRGTNIARQLGANPGDARCLVIGGGLTAVQAALALVRTGSQVALRSRRPLQTRRFDLQTDWVDMRLANRLRSEFFRSSVEERRQLAKEAVAGGSVPEYYMKELHKLARASTLLEVQLDEAIDESAVQLREGKIDVNGELFDRVILATGMSTEPMLSPLYQQVRDELGAPALDGYPVLDDSLRWAEEEDLFVMGANAVLQLGPGALNLMGAMRGAKIVAEALRDVMWARKGTASPSSVITGNPYAALGIESEGDSDGTDSDDSD